MKKRLKLICGGAVIAVVLVCSMLYVKTSLGGNDTETLPLSYVAADLAYDADDLREAVGVSDYVFVGKVTGAEDTHYYMLSDDMGLPFTNYTVQVTENIKGELVTQTPVEITKEGGVSFDKDSIVVYMNDEMPEVGKTYIFRAYTQSDGSLLVSGPNSNAAIEDNGTDLYAEADVSKGKPLLKQYAEAYENEVDPLGQERLLSVYDQAKQ